MAIRARVTAFATGGTAPYQYAWCDHRRKSESRGGRLHRHHYRRRRMPKRIDGDAYSQPRFDGIGCRYRTTGCRPKQWRRSDQYFGRRRRFDFCLVPQRQCGWRTTKPDERTGRNLHAGSCRRRWMHRFFNDRTYRNSRHSCHQRSGRYRFYPNPASRISVLSLHLNESAEIDLFSTK